MDEQQTHTKCLHALCCCVCLCAYRCVPFVCALVCVCVCACTCACVFVMIDVHVWAGTVVLVCIAYTFVGLHVRGNGRVWWASVDTWIGIGRFVG